MKLAAAESMKIATLKRADTKVGQSCLPGPCPCVALTLFILSKACFTPPIRCHGCCCGQAHSPTNGLGGNEHSDCYALSDQEVPATSLRIAGTLSGEFAAHAPRPALAENVEIRSQIAEALYGCSIDAWPLQLLTRTWSYLRIRSALRLAINR